MSTESNLNTNAAAGAQTGAIQAQTPAEFLRALFLDRKQRNTSYSTRALARDLGMSQTLVSLVMNGKRPLTVKQAAQISVLLDFNKDQAQAFLESTLLALPENSKALKRLRKAQKSGTFAHPEKANFVNYDLERFKAISQWYHFAILDLTTTATFQNDAVWISRRLGISPIEATDALERLVSLGLLLRQGLTLKKADNKVFFATQRSEAAIRNHHQQMIGKALEHLRLTDQGAFESRQISGMTMAIPKSLWPEAKKRLQEFQKELAAFVGQSDCDEVYQLNVQMFPLTQTLKGKE